MRGDKVDCARFFNKIDIPIRMFVRQHPGLPRGNDRDDFCPAVVFFEKAVDKLRKGGVSHLCRLIVKSENVFGSAQLRHRPRVDVFVRAMELNKRVIEREAFFERLVGNRAAVELNRVAHGEVEERRTVLRGPCAAVEESRPVVELHLLEFVGMREHLPKLRFERSGDLLWRPRRHLVLRGFVVELRRCSASPSPAAGVLLVGVSEMELQHGLERTRLRVDGRGERGEPFVGTRLAVGELLHRVFADEERTRGVRPAPCLRRLALDLLDLVRDGARQILPLRRLDVWRQRHLVVHAKILPKTTQPYQPQGPRR